MLDLEALLEQQLELAPDRVAVGFGLDEHVRRERREARADLPHVQVVHLGDAGIGGHRRADLRHVEPRRGDLEQDPAGGTQGARPPPAHQRGDDQRRDRVGAVEAGGRGSAPRDRGRRERVQVGQQVLEGALDVERARFAWASSRVASRLTTIPASATARIVAPLGMVGVISRCDRAEHDQAPEHEQRRPVCLRGEHLHPAQAEGDVAPARAA